MGFALRSTWRKEMDDFFATYNLLKVNTYFHSSNCPSIFKFTIQILLSHGLTRPPSEMYRASSHYLRRLEKPFIVQCGSQFKKVQNLPTRGKEFSTFVYFQTQYECARYDNYFKMVPKR